MIGNLLRALVVLLILASLVVTVYRFSLPWEGWS